MLLADSSTWAYSSEKVQKQVSEFGKVCKRGKLKINVNESKVIRFSTQKRQNMCGISLNEETVEYVECFTYLGMDMIVNGTGGAKVSHRVGEGSKILGVLRNVWKEGSQPRELK